MLQSSGLGRRRGARSERCPRSRGISYTFNQAISFQLFSSSHLRIFFSISICCCLQSLPSSSSTLAPGLIILSPHSSLRKNNDLQPTEEQTIALLATPILSRQPWHQGIRAGCHGWMVGGVSYLEFPVRIAVERPRAPDRLCRFR